MSQDAYTNRLIEETSPYLLQHAHNPVQWHPWGEEALDRARREDKPILLSIGYSACHWCHVMERESFENEETAHLMNELFIPIKVDREERPDLDEIYMNAVQIMTGSGGWPLTVFLTPELKPFYGGTYFPPSDRLGRPGFPTVLQEISRLYREHRGQVETQGDEITERLKSMARISPSREILSLGLMGQAVRDLAHRFDPVEGGFGHAPKFPPSGSLAVLLRYHRRHQDREALNMVELTLDKMAAGGMYDHLGGGFHRYSTDDRWLVPHFEKMLYDNALLAAVYLDAFRVTGTHDYAKVARETLEYVLREMQSPAGGYYSTQDADSEGEEGKFYVWTRDEIVERLGPRSEAFCRFYDVTAAGNWEGKNILHRSRSLESAAAESRMTPGELEKLLDEASKLLLELRLERTPPGLDDKVLTSWNGLMIIAMARGYRVLGDQRYLDSARRSARFILDNMIREGRLLATYRDGRARFPAYLDDYAFLIGGLVELYESDFDLHWIEEAVRLSDALTALFWDGVSGGFFLTGSDHEPLLVRPKSATDAAIPSGNAMAATYLLRLSAYTGIDDYGAKAQETIRSFHTLLERFPSAFSQMLCALDDYLGNSPEVAIVGSADTPDAQDALHRIWRIYNPYAVVAFIDRAWPNRSAVEDRIPLLQGKPSADGKLLFYLCENYRCQAPTGDIRAIEQALRS